MERTVMTVYNAGETDPKQPDVGVCKAFWPPPASKPEFL